MEDQERRRKQAIGRIKAKREFRQHLMIYVVVNLLLNVVWAVTSPGDYYWPVWPLLGWGLGLFFHGYGVYRWRPIGEDEIERELQAMDRASNERGILTTK